jgi:hypothetical protein
VHALVAARDRPAETDVLHFRFRGEVVSMILVLGAVALAPASGGTSGSVVPVSGVRDAWPGGQRERVPVLLG